MCAKAGEGRDKVLIGKGPKGGLFSPLRSKQIVMEMEHSVTARVCVFRSRYSSKADDTVEEVEFWEGVPKGPSRLLLPGTTLSKLRQNSPHG